MQADRPHAANTKHRRMKSKAADVRGVPLGASEDGAYVYFVADGVLSEVPNARAKRRNRDYAAQKVSREATCNIYMDHYDATTKRWAEPRFIAAVAAGDSPDWERRTGAEGHHSYELADVTSRVSPNGRYLAFMSERELTGYDNIDGDPQAGGAHDEEVYEYAAPSAVEESRRARQARVRLLRPVRRAPARHPRPVRRKKRSGTGIPARRPRGSVERKLAGGKHPGLDPAAATTSPRSPCTSRATSRTSAACTSTALPTSCRRPPTAGRTSTSTSPRSPDAARTSAPPQRHLQRTRRRLHRADLLRHLDRRIGVPRRERIRR